MFYKVSRKLQNETFDLMEVGLSTKAIKSREEYDRGKYQYLQDDKGHDPRIDISGLDFRRGNPFEIKKAESKGRGQEGCL